MRRVLTSALVVLAPLVLAGWTMTAVLADSGPSAKPAGSSALPGDPAKGQQLFGSAGCTACHGASLEGGIGPRLNPIVTLPDTKDPLNPTYLIDTITNGKQNVGGFGQMPPKGGDEALTAQDIKDLASYLITTNNQKGPVALGPVELARSNVFWVTLGIVVMLFLTLLLSRYNMRWVDRRAAGQRERRRTP